MLLCFKSSFRNRRTFLIYYTAEAIFHFPMSLSKYRAAIYKHALYFQLQLLYFNI